MNPDKVIKSDLRKMSLNDSVIQRKILVTLNYEDLNKNNISTNI